MQYTKEMSALLVILMIIVTMSFVPSVLLNAQHRFDIDNELLTSPLDTNQDNIIPLEDQYPKGTDHFIAESNVIHEGVLNLVSVEQSGYAASE
ncbi:MAG: hypothetical protein IH631_01900, partial [Candidatus Thorarchaeota archaeon]|nr:hypothetical protein [Candidatus Thorarchaeota archaeon]